MKILDKFKKKYICFNCNKEIDKKDVYNIKLNTSEGLIELKSCDRCAEELNIILKDFEEAFPNVKGS